MRIKEQPILQRNVCANCNGNDQTFKLSTYKEVTIYLCNKCLHGMRNVITTYLSKRNRELAKQRKQSA